MQFRIRHAMLAVVCSLGMVNQTTGQTEAVRPGDSGNVSVELLSRRGFAGDLAFYRFVVTNRGDSAIDLAGTGALGVTHIPRVNCDQGNRLRRAVFHEMNHRNMIPQPIQGVAAGESWSFISLFQIPPDFGKDRRKVLVFNFVGVTGHEQTKFRMFVKDRICDQATHQEIFESQSHGGGPFIPFNEIVLEPSLAKTVKPYIGRLREGSNLRQLFQFMVDGWEIVKRSQDPAAVTKSLKRLTAAMNPELRLYVNQLIPNIVNESLRLKALKPKSIKRPSEAA